MFLADSDDRVAMTWCCLDSLRSTCYCQHPIEANRCSESYLGAAFVADLALALERPIEFLESLLILLIRSLEMEGVLDLGRRC